ERRPLRPPDDRRPGGDGRGARRTPEPGGVGAARGAARDAAWRAGPVRVPADRPVLTDLGSDDGVPAHVLLRHAAGDPGRLGL
ncbi:MAG: hypothetical protein AVDCRST_MAG79-2392, partial [uncultured Thermoleophilia bacterium]